MKKKIIIALAILACLTVAVGGTLAWFVTYGTARNVITTGGIDVEVVEHQIVNGEPVPYPPEPIQIVPATSVSKVVSAKSLDAPAWVRMTYVTTVLDANGKVKDIPADNLAKAVIVHINSNNWTEKDGWWYYKDALSADEVSTPLIESVSFSGPDMGNEYQNCRLLVTVFAEAVQQANNGDTVMDATGWSGSET